MAVALSICGITLAAICIWLTVRIVNRRERWAKWTLTAVIGLPALYVVSFGPACWIGSRTGIDSVDRKLSASLVSVVYQPMLRLCVRDTRLGDAFLWYASIGTKNGIFTARDAERRVVIQWEPWRIGKLLIKPPAPNPDGTPESK
jgi:hypothetical protein